MQSDPYSPYAQPAVYTGYAAQHQQQQQQQLAATKPRLLIMGLRRSGKSSILNVIFHKMSPNETLFLESTSIVSRNDILSFLDFQLWDFPGHVDLYDPAFDPVLIFQQCGALVFVIDAQDDTFEALQRLYMVITRAYKVNPLIAFEVFIHKVDGLSDDHKIETQREIYQRLSDELGDTGLDAVHLSFHLTSIYDHSVFEAFSKVVQKLIHQLPTLENLLNMLCSNTGIEKTFLFDLASKIYIATDSSPVDMQSYELCSDMIDVVLDITSIYSRPAAAGAAAAGATGSGLYMLEGGQRTGPATPGTMSSPVSANSGVLGAGSAVEMSRFASGAGRTAEAAEAAGAAVGGGLAVLAADASGGPGSADDSDHPESCAGIRLNNGMGLYLRQVNPHLVLVALMREDTFEKQGLVDYNFRCVASAINQVFKRNSHPGSSSRADGQPHLQPPHPQPHELTHELTQ